MLKEKAAWLKERIEQGYSSEIDQLWVLGDKLKSEDATVAKATVLINTQRYKLAKYAGSEWPILLAYLQGKTPNIGGELDNIVGLLGREEEVADLVAEIKKGKHVILTGPVGIGKSALLWAALETVGKHIDWLIMLRDHQAKGQFVDMARQMLALGLISAEELDLPVKFHGVPATKHCISWAAWELRCF